MRWKIFHLSLITVLVLLSPVATAVGQGPGLMLVDADRLPSVTVSWARAGGEPVSLHTDLAYASQDDRALLGQNLEVFVALGGTRLEKGAGRPSGAIVRVGLVKTDRDLMMFEDIANGTEVTVELRGVYFNQPATPDPDTLIQRLRYKVDDVVACGLTINQAEMFNVVSEDDDMDGTILPEQVRFGCLDTDGDDGGSEISVGEGGEIALRVVIPYRLLRHKGDPWALEIPGSFFEPFQFDLEFEVLPADVAAAEGITGG